MVSGCRYFYVLELNKDDAAFNARGVGAHAGRDAGRALNHTGLQTHLPGMQRTDDRIPSHDPVAERTSTVRASIIESQKTVTEIEDRDLAITDRRRAPFAWRNVLAGRDAHPSSQ